MNLSQEKALYHLTGQTKTGGATLNTVQQLVDNYPYFAPAQCLLAYQFKKEEHPMVVLQTVKTALYFTNPYWLQYQLKEDGAANKKIAIGSNNAVLSDMQIVEDVSAAPVKADSSPASLLSGNLAIPTIEAVKEMMRKIDARDPEESEPADISLIEESKLAPIDEAVSDNKIASLLSNQLADFNKPVEADARLDIETPQEKLFMVDYFASQGIKIDLSSIPQDKLTVHLRKFTDWLRQVKQGELNPRDLVANIALEQAVAQTAQISNQKEDILTEAMAEVLEKQGQVEKAIEVYAKLSFLNPEKSSYFAAKIEQLKGI